MLELLDSPCITIAVRHRIVFCIGLALVNKRQMAKKYINQKIPGDRDCGSMLSGIGISGLQSSLPRIPRHVIVMVILYVPEPFGLCVSKNPDYYLYLFFMGNTASLLGD